MFETIFAIGIVAAAAVFVGRSMHRTMAGKKGCATCSESCPISSGCDSISDGEERVEAPCKAATHV